MTRPKPRENAGFFIFQKYFRFGVAVSENETYDPDVASERQPNDEQGDER